MYNVRGVRSKVEILDELMVEEKLDVLALSETFFAAGSVGTSDRH